MPKAEKIWSGILVGIWVLLRTFLLLLTAWAVFFEAIFFVDRMPKTVDSAESGEYTLLLQTLGSPGWPFGPQDGRIVLKKGGRTV